MNSNLKACVLPFVLAAIAYALGVATGAGASARSQSRREARPPEARSARARSRIADTDDAAKVAALEARVRTLQRKLDRLLQAEAEEPREETPVAAQGPAVPQMAMTHRERMEQMRRENPEQYQQMTNNMARWRQAGYDRAVGRLDTLASVDVSGWSQEAQATHQEYQGLLARREELFEMLRPENEDEESRQAAHDELRQVFGRLNQLAGAERDNLLVETANGFGLKGKDRKELVETVKAVFDVTSDWGGHGGGRHGGGRRNGRR